ncbi:hypothetical protein KA531_00610 [Candidatus Saccharibacteria bacterium]|nr:hypothetical protein [Candidatus Saccharibacteria bacterium]
MRRHEEPEDFCFTDPVFTDRSLEGVNPEDTFRSIGTEIGTSARYSLTFDPGTLSWVISGNRIQLSRIRSN